MSLTAVQEVGGEGGQAQRLQLMARGGSQRESTGGNGEMARAVGRPNTMVIDGAS